jgi:hypothetical protein
MDWVNQITAHTTDKMYDRPATHSSLAQAANATAVNSIWMNAATLASVGRSPGFGMGTNNMYRRTEQAINPLNMGNHSMIIIVHLSVPGGRKCRDQSTVLRIHTGTPKMRDEIQRFNIPSMMNMITQQSDQTAGSGDRHAGRGGMKIVNSISRIAIQGIIAQDMILMYG